MPEDDDHPSSSVDGDVLEPGPSTSPDLPSMAVPAEERMDLESILPEVRRLKVVGVVLFILSGLTAVLPRFLLVEGTTLGFRTVSAMALAVVGVLVGVSGLVSPTLRRWALLVAPVVLIAAGGAGSPGVSLDDIPPLELVLAFAFGLTLLLAIEHLHAVMRFVELGTYVVRQRLTSFQLSNVVTHFQVYGLAVAALVALVGLFVVVGMPWVLGQGSNELLGRAAELHSVFGIALASAVVFTLSAIILLFIRSAMPQRIEVESVAYSRERMEDMLRSGGMLETRMEGGRPPS